MSVTSKDFGLDKYRYRIFLLKSDEDQKDVAVVRQAQDGRIKLTCFCSMDCCPTRPEQKASLQTVLGQDLYPWSEKLPVKDGEIARLIEKTRLPSEISDTLEENEELERNIRFFTEKISEIKKKIKEPPANSQQVFQLSSLQE
ncbi:MAG: hypothetical protein WCK60_02930 [Candidatus Nomurabacteria bacterium]